MFFSSDPSEWAALAIALGFTPHEPVAGFGQTASFRQLKRSLGRVAGPPPEFRHWLRGRRNGRRHLVVFHIVSHGSTQESWTTTVTEIDPPLFVGASIGREGVLATFFGGEDLKLGIPPVDEALRLGALDAPRFQALLTARAGEPTFLMGLASLVKQGFAVTDSTVTCATRGHVTDPGQIARSLDSAAWVAHELEVRRATLPTTPAEARVQRDWRAFADARGLAFDPSRMHMHGTLMDAGVEIALETNAGVVQTAIGVRFPRPVAMRLHVQKAGVFAFLTRLFKTTIETGDAAFDGAFILEGEPAAAIRHAFANPALRATLLRIASAAREVTMTEDQVYWLWPAATLGADGLAAHVEAATAASRALFGASEPRGPYR